MTDQDERRRLLEKVAERWEAIADELEKIAPAVKAARQGLSGLARGAMRHAGIEGSVDAFDALAAQGLGYARVEEARRRIYLAVRDPADELTT